MGIFKRAQNAIMAAEKATRPFESGLLKPLQKTFIDPLAKEFIRPFVGQKQKSIETPFGNVKSYYDVKPGEALSGALEVGLTVPASAYKGAAKIVQPLFKKAGGKVLESAASTFSKALAPTKEKMKAITAKIAPEAAGKVVGTMKGIVNKAKGEMEKLGDQFESFSELKGGISGQPVVDKLVEMRDRFFIAGPNSPVNIDPRGVSVVDNVIDTVKSLTDETGNISKQAMRELRRKYDALAATSGAFMGKTLKEGTEVSIKKEASDVMRNLLAEAEPELAKINREYSFWKNLSDVASESAKRKVGQTGFIRKMFGALVGSSMSPAGPIGQTAGVAIGSKLGDMLGSTLFRTASASTKKKVADLLLDASTDTDKLVNFFRNPAFTTLKIKDLVKYLNEPQEEMTQESQAQMPLNEIFMQESEQGNNAQQKSLEDIFNPR